MFRIWRLDDPFVFRVGPGVLLFPAGGGGHLVLAARVGTEIRLSGCVQPHRSGGLRSTLVARRCKHRQEDGTSLRVPGSLKNWVGHVESWGQFALGLLEFARWALD